MNITGTITKILDVQSGTSKAGKDWQKLIFLVTTEEEHNNLYAFEVFGVEKVNKFNKFNSIGDVVSVEFNISTNEWQGKYFTSLQAWLVKKAESNNTNNNTNTNNEEPVIDDSSPDDLPF